MHQPQPVDRSNIDAPTSPSAGPALLEIWAAWCAACLALAPELRELAHDLRGVAAVGRVDIDANPDLAARFGVVGAPTLVVFIGGQPVAHRVGFRSSTPLRRRIHQVLESTPRS
jgi:thioredoxin 1